MINRTRSWRRELAVTHNNLGALLEARRPADARSAFQEDSRGRLDTKILCEVWLLQHELHLAKLAFGLGREDQIVPGQLGGGAFVRAMVELSFRRRGMSRRGRRGCRDSAIPLARPDPSRTPRPRLAERPSVKSV